MHGNRSSGRERVTFEHGLDACEHKSALLDAADEFCVLSVALVAL
jgi:hypothetical protein